MNIEEMKRELSLINKIKIVDEIFWWLRENIVNYIDTHNFSYSLSFLSHEEKMPETAKIEHLFSQFNVIDMSQFDGMSEKEIMESYEMTQDALNQEAINEFMEEVKDLMIEDKENLKILFKAISEYYSLVGFYNNSPLVKKLDGYIDIEYLSFENLTLDVIKTPLIPVYDREGNIVDYKKDDSKKETLTNMPESFCIDMTINLWEGKNESSIF